MPRSPLGAALVAAAVALPVVAFAGAPKPLKLEPSKDTHALAKAVMQMTLGPMIQCLKGKPRTEAAQRACACENKPFLEKKLAAIDAIVKRHPAWSKAPLHFKDGDSTYDITVVRMQRLKKVLAGCGASSAKAGKAGKR